MAIPVTSSVDNQTPPLEWINASQIVYRHMPDAKRRRPGTFDVLCVFKCVDVSVGSIVEVLQETLHLGVGSGSLKVNPLNGELVYSSSTWIVDDLWVLDPNQGTLTPAIHPFSVVNEHYPDRAKVYFGERLLQAVDGMIAPTLISPLHGNLAYVLHPADPDPNTILSVKIVGEPDPIEVEECPNAIVPVGWIEQR